MRTRKRIFVATRIKHIRGRINAKRKMVSRVIFSLLRVLGNEQVVLLLGQTGRHGPLLGLLVLVEGALGSRAPLAVVATGIEVASTDEGLLGALCHQRIGDASSGRVHDS